MGLFRFFSRSKMESKPGSSFPMRPLFILALCRICEPIAFTSIFPYIYYMVQTFGITKDEKQISIYAGMVTSAFAIAEFSASIFWGWLSDRVGRKPVLLTGLAGTGISMLVFGFAKSLPVALLARTLGGLLNGNIGVILTTVGEVVTVEAHQSRAFAIMPFVWCIGSIIGAALGGTLADPVKNYPSVFGKSTIFKEYPYLLPNIVCTGVVILGLTVGFLFLEETHQDKRSRNDIGLTLGRRMLRALPCIGNESPDDEEQDNPRHSANDEKGDYRPIPTSPQMTATTAAAASLVEPSLLSEKVESEPKISVYKSLTRQIKLIVISYGLLAFHTIALEQLLPILFASTESKIPPVYPFKFDGGFDLSASTIGIILSFQGFLQMIAQVVIFPRVSDRFGPLVTFRIAVMGYPILYLLIPYLALAPQSLRFVCISLVLLWKVTAQSFSFPSQSIMLANSAPSKRVLGTLNGIAMSAASLARALGPTIIGYVHALGRQSGYSIFSWWSCALIAVIGATVSLLMVEPARPSANVAVGQEDHDEERAEAQPLLGRLSDEIEASSSLSSVVDEPLQ